MQITANEFLRSIWVLYRHAAVEATISFRRNILLLVAGPVAFICYMVLSSLLFGRGDFSGGILRRLLELVFISLSYCWLRNAVGHNRFILRSLYELDLSLFSAIISTGFILYLVKLLFTQILFASVGAPLQILFSIILFVGLNALPETLYLQRLQGFEAITESAQFVWKNWIEWFLPLCIVILPVGLLSLNFLISLLLHVNEFFPAAVYWKSITAMIFSTTWSLESLWVRYLIGYGIAVPAVFWIFLFRGFLYQSLQSGSRRQRIFRAKQH